MPKNFSKVLVKVSHPSTILVIGQLENWVQVRKDSPAIIKSRANNISGVVMMIHQRSRTQTTGQEVTTKELAIGIAVPFIDLQAKVQLVVDEVVGGTTGQFDVEGHCHNMWKSSQVLSFSVSHFSYKVTLDVTNAIKQGRIELEQVPAVQFSIGSSWWEDELCHCK